MVDTLSDHNEIQLFHELFDDDVIELICQESTKYAQQNNRHTFTLRKWDLQRFVGFLLFSGYHRLPRERMYWENSDDCMINIVTKSLSSVKYREIKRNIHLAANSAIDGTDKIFKVRRYIEKLNSNFMKFGCFTYKLSIDEQMVPYFGRHHHHHHHHHQFNVHFLPRSIKGMDGCFPTALGRQSTFSNILGPLV